MFGKNLIVKRIKSRYPLMIPNYQFAAYRMVAVAGLEPVLQTFSKSSKKRSLVIPAVVILVRICVTGTSLGLVFRTIGLFIPDFVIMMWSPFVLWTVKPSSSKTFIRVA